MLPPDLFSSNQRYTGPQQNLEVYLSIRSQYSPSETSSLVYSLIIPNLLAPSFLGPESVQIPREGKEDCGDTKLVVLPLHWDELQPRASHPNSRARCSGLTLESVGRAQRTQAFWKTNPVSFCQCCMWDKGREKAQITLRIRETSSYYANCRLRAPKGNRNICLRIWFGHTKVKQEPFVWIEYNLCKSRAL